MAAIINICSEKSGTEVAGNTNPATSASIADGVVKTRGIARRARGYMITINNPTEDEEKAFQAIDCEYSIYQWEMGENKTPHMQCFIYFKNARGWPKDLIPRAHIEVARSVPDSIKYCSKLETRIPGEKAGPHEKGIRPVGQGHRSDLDTITMEIKRGANMADIAEKHSSQFSRYHKGFDALQKALIRPRTAKPYVIWVCGPTGTGKTRWCTERDPTADIYYKDNSIWWTGYTGQKAVIIDDFNNKKWDIRDLLRLLDRYPYQGQTKGGYVNINSPTIYFTCDRHYDSIAWEGDGIDLKGQFERRIDAVKRFAAVPDAPEHVPVEL